MIGSQAVAKVAGAGATAFGPKTSDGRANGFRRLRDAAVSNDAAREMERKALRHRLLQMILRNEEMRRRRPR